MRSGKPGIALTACRSALSVVFLVVIRLGCVAAAFTLAFAFFAMASQGWVKKWVLIIIDDSGGRKLGGFSRSVPGLEAAYRGLLGSAHADPLAITGAVVVHVLAG